MRTKNLLVVLAIVGTFCSLVVARSSSAQQNPCIIKRLYFFWDTDIPANYVCGPGEGPFSMLCVGPSVDCSGKIAVCPTCESGGRAAVGGNPINLSTGNTYVQEGDVKLPGLGGGISLVRTWNSIWPAAVSSYKNGMFGPNWRSTYEERINSDPSTPSYLKSDGSLYYFFGSGSSYTLAAPANAVATLTNDGTYWTLTFQNGEKRIFSYASGSLLQIVDRNGNTTQLTYNGTNQLTTVTDAASRHLYFTYTGSVVTSVTSDFGISLSYTYDTSGRLTKVTKPDSSSWNFEYNSASLISSVKDGSGIVLESHTYDSAGRGLTSSQAGGVNAITVSYH